MSKHDNIDETWEARINALLDGELKPQEIDELKTEAQRNAALAQAIIDAYALQAGLDELEVERAPASLRSRLANIPAAYQEKQPKRWFGMPRWAPAGALAAVPLLVIAMVMMQSQPEPAVQPEFTEAEVLQARQEVMIAFAYLDEITHRAGQQVESEISEELSSGVNRNVTRYMPYTNNSLQEENS